MFLHTALLTSHRLKERAAGRPVVMVPIIPYSHDTSSNKPKKWHKMDSWCILFAGLPRETNAQLASIHLICCSDTVSFLDMRKWKCGPSHVIDMIVERYGLLFSPTERKVKVAYSRAVLTYIKGVL